MALLNDRLRQWFCILKRFLQKSRSENHANELLSQISIRAWHIKGKYVSDKKLFLNSTLHIN